MDNYIEDIEDQFKDLAQGGDEDEGGETDDGYALASAGFGSDEDYESVNNEGGRDPEDWDEGNTEPPNNFAVSINGKQWKVFKGRGQYADDPAERKHYYQLKDWAAKKSEATGKRWTVSVTGEPATESIQKTEDMNTNEAYINSAKDAIDILADIRQQSKLASRGESEPVRPNQLVNDLWDVMQWIEANMKE
jgi:formylglycine-generating enzyme required for sulfatase activity